MSVYDKANKQREEPEWKKQLAKELLAPARKKFPRRTVYSPGLNWIWTSDLADQSRYARVNKGYKWIIVVLDVFTRYAYAKPMKRKTAECVAHALEEIINEAGTSPTFLWTDKGTEYKNILVDQLLKQHGIKLYSTENEPKGMIAERFIRTLRERLQRTYILTDSTVWWNKLPAILNEYNNHPHKHLRGMTPEQARKEESRAFVYRCQFPKRKREEAKKEIPLAIGTKVRISLVKRPPFEKGTTKSWSEEIFKVKSRTTSSQGITTYTLEDTMEEPVEGAFYPQQLQKTNQNIYRIDRVLRRRKAPNGTQQLLVKWFGYPDKFNQWLPAADVLKSGAANPDTSDQ